MNSSHADYQKLSMRFFILFCRCTFVFSMNEELQNRFFQKKLKDLLNDSTKPFPTCIFEKERTEVTELVRRFCLRSPLMIKYKANDFTFVSELLEKKSITNFGDLYCPIYLS